MPQHDICNDLGLYVVALTLSSEFGSDTLQNQWVPIPQQWGPVTFIEP